MSASRRPRPGKTFLVVIYAIAVPRGADNMIVKKPKKRLFRITDMYETESELVDVWVTILLYHSKVKDVWPA